MIVKTDCETEGALHSTSGDHVPVEQQTGAQASPGHTAAVSPPAGGRWSLRHKQREIFELHRYRTLFIKIWHRFIAHRFELTNHGVFLCV